MWGDLFQTIFLKFIAPVMTALIMALVAKLVAAINKKYHLGILKLIEDKLVKDVNVAVLSEENKAADAIKVTGNSISGGQKFANVLNNVVAATPGVDPEHVKQLIEATVISTPGIGPVDLVARPGGCDATTESSGKVGGSVSGTGASTVWQPSGGGDPGSGNAILSGAVTGERRSDLSTGS